MLSPDRLRITVKDPDGAGYPESFDSNGSHNMTKVAKFDSYRGFLFGSLNPDSVELSEHLGDKHAELVPDLAARRARS